MKVNEILLEATNKKVILVDFQPEYESAYDYKNAFHNAINFLNKNKPKDILIFFNGPELGFDETPETILMYYIENGLDEEVGQNITFRDKSYGFFRAWMDLGIDDNTIIKIIRYMVMNRIYDSRDIDEETFIEILGENTYNEYKDIIESDPLIIPDVAINELKRFSCALIGGGGKDECLREIQLLMNAFNIKYKIVRDWLYG